MRFYGLRLMSFALCFAHSQAAYAQDFGGTGRVLTHGFGDRTSGLQREADTFGFGRYDFPYHVGIDIAAPAGTPIYAAAAGEVTSPGPSTRESANKVLVLGDAATGANLMTYEFVDSIQVVAGDRILAGSLLGFVAARHSEIGGSHLHFGISDSRGREIFDPVPLLLDDDGLAECVDLERAVLAATDGGYELNRVRRVWSGSLDVPALLFPVQCFVL